MIRAVVFDVGETLVDESNEYGTWADWLGVPRHTFSAVFGATIAAGRDYRETFQVFRPGFDLTVERQARAAAGKPEWFGEDALYPDARSCLEALQAAGVQVGVAGNQTARAEQILRDLELPFDWLGTSEGWGVEKPAPEFFTRIVAEAQLPADEVLYVGDRLDNDIKPAQDGGMLTALVRRGPWAWIVGDAKAEARCRWILDDLDQLPALVAKANSAQLPAHATATRQVP